MTYAEIPLNPEFLDINPIRAGVAFASTRNSHPIHKLGYTMLHYVSEGSGSVFVDRQIFPVKAGQVFIVPAGHFAFVKCNDDDPWAYRWVGFSGKLSHDFESFPRVADAPETFLDILHTTGLPDLPRKQVELQLTADLFSLYARLSANCTEPVDETTQCVYDVADHIRLNCRQKLSVEDIALLFNYDRTYLCKQFKKRMGCSIQQYILDTRFQKAIWMLENGVMTSEVAAACGFSDVSNFSKSFTRWLGMTPSQYKQMMKNDYEAFRNHNA